MNILLTSLSKLPKFPSINFYQSHDKYTSGVSQLEAGSKFFLSRHSINRIIAIGSDETYSKNDILEIQDLRNNDFLSSISGIQDLSAYGLYQYRMYQFLNNLDYELNSKDTNQIPHTRIVELQDMLKEEIQKKGFENLSEISLDPIGLKCIFDSVSKKIRENITNQFAKQSDYDQYDELMEQFHQKNDNDLFVQEEIHEIINRFEKDMEEVLSNKSYSTMYKELFCIHFVEEIQKRYVAKQEENKEVIHDLEKLITKLRFEINTNKQHRIQNETDFIKRYIYINIPVENKLHPKENLKVSLTFIPSQKTTKEGNSYENIKEILEKIADTNGEEINLYIDVQGGSRTDSYVRNSVISILNNDAKSNLKVRQIVATQFSQEYFFSQIVDETDKYKITDLVSGMNAFIRYGKADDIESYIREREPSQRIQNIVSNMKKIDEALMLCDITSLQETLPILQNSLNTKEENQDSLTNVFSIVEESIKEDYKDIFSGDLIELIKWAIQKRFIQQAITIIESRLPSILVKKGILYYCESIEKKEEVLKKLSAIYPDQKKNWRFKEDLDSFFIRQNFPQKEVEIVSELLSKNEKKLIPYSLCKKEEYPKLEAFLKTYFDICSLRNQTNHSSNKRRNIQEVVELLTSFVEQYYTILSTMDNKDFVPTTITFEEIEEYHNEPEKKIHHTIQSYFTNIRNISTNEARGLINQPEFDILSSYKIKLQNICSEILKMKNCTPYNAPKNRTEFQDRFPNLYIFWDNTAQSKSDKSARKCFLRTDKGEAWERMSGSFTNRGKILKNMFDEGIL
ncbi:MAG: TM1812 family CRISPR-associated protein [Bacillota bacterium]|nr:TM1812 family CRISPR-associated protein [Bacillota bacterium]